MIEPRNSHEEEYVDALSRSEIIKAYSNWNELSKTENLLLNQFLDTDSNILDLGCGTGRIVSIFNPSIDNYIGVDCSAQMIQMAKVLHPNHKFICEDFLDMSLGNKTFDIVLLMNNVVDMLNPYERRISLFNLCKTLLGKNGVLIYSTHLLNNKINSGYFSENYHGVDVNTYRSSYTQICNEIEDFGFEIIISARDYRAEKADWAYLAVKVI